MIMCFLYLFFVIFYNFQLLGVCFNRLLGLGLNPNNIIKVYLP